MRYRFETCRLDGDRRELLRGAAVVRIAPKAFSVLLHLIENRERMVSKRELLDAFWPPAVSEGVLQTTMRIVRLAIGDDGRGQRMIRTHHGQGFRFVAPVEAEPPAGADEKAPEAAGFEERRLATALACRFARSGAETQAEMTASAHHLVDAHGGIAFHALPDGFTALFGAVRGVEDGTRRAFHCARAILRSPAAREMTLAGGALGMGLDCGRFPVLEAPARLDPPGLPAAVTRAALALAGRAGGGEILLSSAAKLLARPDRGAAGGFVHFCGRQAEMELLKDGFDAAARQRGRAVLVSGEAGIGKSRLMSEFLTGVAARAPRVLTLDCLPLTANTPLSAMGRLCRDITGALEPGARAPLADSADEALLQDLLEPAAAMRLDGLSPHSRRRRTFALVRNLVLTLAGNGVLVIAIEDVHWMDATSRDCLTSLMQGLEGAGVFLLLTARPAPEVAFADGLPLTILKLAPLDRLDSMALIRSKPALESLSRGEALGLAARAAGNPFFLEELSRAVEAGSAPDGGLPITVQDMIVARLDALANAARTLLQAIAVVGPTARADLVAELLGWAEEALSPALGALLGAGLVVEDEIQGRSAFRFRHILIQEAAYQMLSRDERIALHRQVADIMRRSGAAPEQLAWHHQEAGDEADAVECWTEAARAAHRRIASREAIAFARNGLKLLAPGPARGAAVRRELELQLTLAPALAVAKGYGAEEVGAAYRRARDLCRRASAADCEFRMLVGLWNYAWVRGMLVEANRHADDLLRLAAREADPQLRLRAHACKGELMFHLGAFGAAETHLDRACALYAALDEATVASRAAAVACHSYAAWTASHLGRPDEAWALSARADAVAREMVQPFSMSLSLALRSELHLFEGDVAGCLDVARRARETSRREGYPFWHGTALVMEGWAEAQSGAQSGAIEPGLGRLRRGIKVFEETGARIQLAKWYGLLAETLILKGDRPEARRASETAAAWARETGDVFFLPRIERVARALGPAS